WRLGRTCAELGSKTSEGTAATARPSPGISCPGQGWGLKLMTLPLTLPPEIWEELAAWLGRGKCYLDEDWPDNFPEHSVTHLDNLSIPENMDIDWAHHNTLSGNPVACLSLNRNGIYTTQSNSGSIDIHWITSETDALKFWRSAIDIQGDNDQSLENLSAHAYPYLYFHSEIWHGIHRLTGGYHANRNKIKKHLATLNDFGEWAFTAPPPALSPQEPRGESTERPSNQIIERRFHGLNITMAPENPNVFRNSRCRAAREITIQSRKIYCEWHAKIEPHTNRIHVYPPIQESNNRLIIAIIDAHLELP
ncbi:hypothetical protein, partial [Pseudomonas aeruginosa]|uniref:hypothetical protein n=1 Tax=Pseudomonas aeruginosa TaxID=287 RepID=UPI001A8F1CD4